MISLKDMEKNIYKLMVYADIITVAGYILGIILTIYGTIFAYTIVKSETLIVVSFIWGIGVVFCFNVISALIKNRAYTLNAIINKDKKCD